MFRCSEIKLLTSSRPKKLWTSRFTAWATQNRHLFGVSLFPWFCCTFYSCQAEFDRLTTFPGFFEDIAWRCLHRHACKLKSIHVQVKTERSCVAATICASSSNVDIPPPHPTLKTVDSPCKNTQRKLKPIHLKCLSSRLNSLQVTSKELPQRPRNKLPDNGSETHR